MAFGAGWLGISGRRRGFFVFLYFLVYFLHFLVYFSLCAALALRRLDYLGTAPSRPSVGYTISERPPAGPRSVILSPSAPRPLCLLPLKSAPLAPLEKRPGGGGSKKLIPGSLGPLEKAMKTQESKGIGVFRKMGREAMSLWVFPRRELLSVRVWARDSGRNQTRVPAEAVVGPKSRAPPPSPFFAFFNGFPLFLAHFLHFQSIFWACAVGSWALVCLVD